MRASIIRPIDSRNDSSERTVIYSASKSSGKSTRHECRVNQSGRIIIMHYVFLRLAYFVSRLREDVVGHAERASLRFTRARDVEILCVPSSCRFSYSSFVRPTSEEIDGHRICRGLEYHKNKTVLVRTVFFHTSVVAWFIIRTSVGFLMNDNII